VPEGTVKVFEIKNNPYLKRLILPDSIEHVGNLISLFELEYINLPDSINWLGQIMETKLTEIVVPDSVKDVEGCAFASNHLLTRLVLPRSLENLAFDAVTGCSALDRIEISEDNEYFCCVDGVLYSKDMKNLIIYPLNKADEVFEIPEGVEVVSDFLFVGCKNLREVKLPSTLTTLSMAMFNTSSVEKVNLNYVEKLSSGTFSGCTNIKVLVLPENIKEIGTVSIEGSYVSSRSVNGEILLVSRFQVGRNPDFSDPSCFIPGYKTADGEYRVPVENIVAPETLTDSCYTVTSALDQNGLTMDFCTALLSYSNEIYVSGDSIYATHGYNHRVTEGQVTTSEQVTEITRVRYGEGFEIVGTATVKGSVKDQYSMDEYEGMLRVVTTTMRSKIKETVFEDGNALAEFVGGEEIGSNASLYILNADTMEIVQSVENFAPWGETVQSARFDGVSAYVCTSVQLSDPVFFFDLSDIDHITWKDTGEIAGFSSSLIQLGDGYLLGVGRGNSWDSVKIEIYEESGDGVVSVCAYEAKGYYSPTYKSYFIDREERLLGVPINFIEGVHAGRDLYVLLHFDGYQLVEIVTVPTDGYGEMIRAFMDGGCLYVYGRFGFDVAYVGG
jgi:uncharacterized secreted protein with C-terminal beta-propeller domain